MENRNRERSGTGSLEPVEIEATLAVVSENPGELLGKIGELATIAGFILAPGQNRAIHDIYFDTPDRRLAKGRIGLRVRRYDDALLLTLKGPSEKGDTPGGIRRFELEQKWSEEMPEKVRELLSQRGIVLSRGRNKSGKKLWDPLESMKQLGLEVVQDRKTARGIRNIVTPSGEILAEMALDTVTYGFGQGIAVHREVEVEATGPKGVPAMEAVVHGLEQAFGKKLRPWNHGKLVTGGIIEKMMGSGRLRDLIHAGGNLGPAAYDLIEEEFKGPG